MSQTPKQGAEVLDVLRSVQARSFGTPAALLPIQLLGPDVDALLQYVDTLRANVKAVPGVDPEAYRREQPSLSAYPVDSKVIDYAEAGNRVSRAMHHLDEALPTGQRIRAELAMHMLRRGVEELAVWMRARGYTV